MARTRKMAIKGTLVALLSGVLASGGYVNPPALGAAPVGQRGDRRIAAPAGFAAPSDAQLKQREEQGPQADQPQLAHAYGQLPLYFIENKGQIDGRVKYYEKSAGHTTFFTHEGMHLALTKPTAASGQWPVTSGKFQASHEWRVISDHSASLRPLIRTPHSATHNTHAVTLRPVGMRPEVEIVSEQPQEGKVNYFLGSDPAKWRANVPTYGVVVYKEAYAGVDLKFYGNNRQMEYDVIVRPGANPQDVHFEMSGVESLEVGAGGELQVHLPDGGRLEHKKPYVYQEIGGKKIEVAGSYKLHGKSTYGFEVGAYDRNHELVIDPVFVYSTYLGGSDWDQAEALALDAAGQVYVTGFTSSLDFPVVNAVDSGGDFQVFVTKLNAAGNALLYSTYLGGGATDEGNDIAVDGSGNAYVTGTTSSPDFPTTSGAFDTTYNDNDNDFFPSDAFATKLGVTGALLYSTYLGGNEGDGGSSIVVDGSGNAYVVGGTLSTNFPLQNPIQAGLQGSSFTDVFITKFNTAGSALLFSTYLGGSGQDHGIGIATDTAGNAYITGRTQSTNFPTLNPFDGTLNGPMDVFITKLSTVGGLHSYSTYLGGDGFDEGHDIVVDGDGNAYVTGETFSGNFPTANALDSTPNGGVDAFITKLNAPGSGLAYSTYLGGGDNDTASDIALDGSGSVYVVGWTRSPNFPLANELDDTLESFDGFDAFIARLNAASGTLLYSTYLGGDRHDLGLGLAADTSSNVYVTGVTESPNFPTTPGAFDVAPNGQEEVFITKIGLGAELTVNTLNDDTNNGDGLCTLREALTAVNNNINFNDCTNTGGFGNDTITFSVSGIITLSFALPVISDPLGLTIDGENNGITVSGDEQVQVLQVAGGAGLVLRNLTIADGASLGSGAGVATLAQHCTVRVTNSTFINNHSEASSGGAIFNQPNCTLTVTNSTFSGNSAAQSGGAISNSGTLTMIHSTLSGNSASTGGGIATFNITTLSNTILANNSGGNCSGALGDAGFNIDSGMTCGFIALNGSQSNTDPLLDPAGLQDNGGPTPTIALCAGTDLPNIGCMGLSPALDIIPSGTFGCGTTITTDQRGVGRPVDGDTNGQADCDSGAYELDADADGDGVTVGEGDCDDAEPAVHPGATEVCDGLDNDCDGPADEGVEISFYGDSDGDGFGDPNFVTIQCTLPPNHATNKTDCNDTNPAIHPGATELCNNVDDDCDGQIDDGAQQNTFYQDSDGDTFGNPAVSQQACTAPAGYVTDNTDCNDANAAIKPGATELCDSTDNNCNSTVDEGFNVGSSCTLGVGACQATGTLACTGNGQGTECSATPSTPGTEVCNNIDDDCDGTVDDTPSDAGQACTTGQLGVCSAGTTACSAGSLSCIQTTQPSAELCSDGLDNDCDGQTDNTDTACHVCGDGNLDPGEQCDDGNIISNDGCSATCQNEGPPANLVLTKTATPNPVKVNQPLTYTIRVTNTGPALVATGVTVTDTLSSLATLVSASASQGSCSGTSPIICTLGNLAKDATATVTLVVKSEKAGKETVITNTATVAGNEPDSNTTNNTATASTTVVGNTKDKKK